MIKAKSEYTQENLNELLKVFDCRDEAELREKMKESTHFGAKVALYGILASREPFTAALQSALLSEITGRDMKDTKAEVDYYADAIGETKFPLLISAIGMTYMMAKEMKKEEDHDN